MKKLNTKMLAMSALFSALIAVGAFIRVPLPALPVTLQMEFVLLAGALLGGGWGLCSVLVYMAMGLLGLPVFAQGGGLAYVLRPSFGYIIGFGLGAYVTGRLARRDEKPGYKRLLAALFAGFGAVYAVGMAYYYLICAFYLGSPIGLWPLVLNCFLLTAPGDALLCLLGAELARRLLPIIKRLP